MFAKIRKIIPSIILACLMFFTNIINAYAYPGACLLSMTRYEQLYSNWCWAACSRSVGVYYGVNKTQSAIVYAVKGSYANKTATSSEVTSALRYATDYEHTVSYASSAKSFETLQSEFVSGYPHVYGITWFLGGGHVVVGCGYTPYKLKIIDPAEDCDTSYYYYSDLVNGTQIESGYGTYTNTWTIK